MYSWRCAFAKNETIFNIETFDQFSICWFIRATDKINQWEPIADTTTTNYYYRIKWHFWSFSYSCLTNIRIRINQKSPDIYTATFTTEWFRLRELSDIAWITAFFDFIYLNVTHSETKVWIFFHLSYSQSKSQWFLFWCQAMMNFLKQFAFVEFFCRSWSYFRSLLPKWQSDFNSLCHFQVTTLWQQ